MDYTSFAPGASAKPSIPPTLPPTLPPAHKRHLPKFVTAIILVLLLGGTACAGFWWWQQIQIAHNDEGLFDVPAMTTQPKAGEANNWKTYRSTSFPGTFQYPVDWTVTEGNNYPGSAQGENYIKISKGPDVIFMGVKEGACLKGATYCKTTSSGYIFSTISLNPEAKIVIDGVVNSFLIATEPEANMPCPSGQHCL